MPDGVSLAAYRIVQEALTNVVRHAAPTRARVFATAGGDGALELRVENDPGAHHRQAGDAGGGHGMSGMRERAELYGGTLTSGPTEDGGWRIAVQLPAVAQASGAPQ